MKKLVLLKIADPEKGVTRQEYEDICRSLGVKPKPATSPAEGTGDEAPPEPDQT